MSAEKVIEITEFTDPVCTWCWGSEPVLRALETRFAGRVRVRFVMGGLVKDISEFYDSYNRIGGDPEESNRQVARHWLEASERHGMPVQAEGFQLFSREHRSTYPLNIAYKAAQFQGDEPANRFLRRMREASAAEARQTNRTEVLIELANEAGLDVAKFIEHFTDGTAQAAFEQDLATTAAHGVRGFPAFLVSYGEKQLLLRGYQSYETMKAVIGSLTGGAVSESAPDRSEEAVMRFVAKYGRVAPVEIQASFDMSLGEASAMIAGLKAKGLIKTTPAGNGLFVEAVAAQLSCDPVSRICNV